jgi:hypothetical protein
MEKKQAMKWVKALRSGKFKQGKQQLRSENDKGGCKHCCLGVLAEISGCNLGSITNQELLNDYGQTEMCGIGNVDGEPDYNEDGDTVLVTMRIKGKLKHFRSLAGANDGGASFKRIATWIEKNYKLL